MFESLDQQMKADYLKAESSNSRYLRWAISAIGGMVVLGGVLFGLHLLQG